MMKIQINDLSHEYIDLKQRQRVHALDHINLGIKENEFLALVGPSGCGKTTLLYSIAGLVRPTEGALLMDNRQITRPGADRGVVFQEYALLPWKSVIENVAFGLKLQGVGRQLRRETAMKFIAMMGLEGFENHYPHQLSGGMKQRVAVARSLAASPDVMLMDEPFAAIDAQTRMTLQEELSNILEKTTMTVVLVTHSVEEAVFLADRVVVLSRRPGKIKEIVDIDIPRSERNWKKINENKKYSKLRDHIFENVRTEVTNENE
jgi:NitT/TauT family transport system ATP-binding protein